MKKRQDDSQRNLAEFRERMQPVRERTNRKLQELFPELQRLPE